LRRRKGGFHHVPGVHIADVEMVGDPPKGSSGMQMEDLRQRTLAEAQRAPETPNPKLLRLRIVNFHRKNPGLSLIVGDGNSMQVVGEVVSLDGGPALGTFTASVHGGYMVNGVIGAVMAANAGKSDVERKLDAEAARAILEKIYGAKAWKRMARGG
jgi:hypothetical protein